MSDEIEVPIEQVQENVHHVAAHGGGANPNFMNRAAMLSALLAVVAAISALFAGHYSNEGMIEQIQSSDQWSYYQAKGIKLSLAEFRNQTNPSAEMTARIEKYKSDQQEIQEKAKEKESESRAHLRRHESLAAAVTVFQIAIALTAISVLTRKRRYLGLAGTLGLGGFLWMLKSFWL